MGWPFQSLAHLLLVFLLPLSALAQTALPTQPVSGSETPACTPHIRSVTAARADAPASTDADPSLDWQPVSLPDNWRWRWPDYDGVVWYHIAWEQVCTDAGASAAAVALTIDSISMAGEVFVNHDLLWRDNHQSEPLSRSWGSPRYWVLPASALNTDGSPDTLRVRVTGIAMQNPGLGLVQLGAPHDMLPLHQRNRWHSRTLFLLNLTISATLGALALCIWLPGRKQPLFGWYALVSLCWVGFGATVQMTETWPFPSSYALARASNLAYIAFAASFCIFTWRLTNHPTPAWVEKSLWSLTASAATAILVTPGWSGMQISGHVFTLLFLGNSWYMVWYALRTRRTDHLVVAVCLLIMTLIGIRDALVLLGIVQSRLFYGPYTCLLFMLMSAVLIRQRIGRDAQRIERFNQELKDAVDYACAELSTTLSQEHTLALANAQLQERLQLAHDLHDGLGGQIVRSIMLVEQTTGPLQKNRFLAMLKLLRDDLRQVVDSDACAGNAIPCTPEEWTIPLRYRFVSLFDELDIRSQWHAPAAWNTPPGALQCILLARVTEEALTNIVKHSHAKMVNVTLEYTSADTLVLRISDDGAGFNAPAVLRAGQGIGMSSMRARMERMGGRLEVHSKPGATVIEATLMLDNPISVPMAPALAASATNADCTAPSHHV